MYYSYFPWTLYSAKLKKQILNPRSVGFFEPVEAEQKNLKRITQGLGNCSEGNKLCFFWLVDPEDGVIADAKFQAFGHSALIGAADIACGFVIGKTYQQVARISPDLLDRQARDKGEKNAFPSSALSHLNMVVDLIRLCAHSCSDVVVSQEKVLPIAAEVEGGAQGGYPGWHDLSPKEKLQLIEEVLNQDIRPYIELDEGGVEVLELAGNHVKIAYQGSCTSCYSAVGATLSYMQNVLRSKLSSDLEVTPDLDQLNF